MKCYPKDYNCFPHNLFENSKKHCFPRYLYKRKGSENLLNPGSVKNIHSQATNIMPIWVDGAQFTAGTSFGISKALQASWSLSKVLPTGFRLRGTYHRQISDTLLTTPFIEAELNPHSLATNFRFQQNLSSNVVFEGDIQVMPWKVTKSVMSVNCIGRDKTTSVTFYNANKNSGVVTVASLFKVSKLWDLGTELMVNWNQNQKLIESRVAAIVKYAVKDFSIATTFSTRALNMTMWHRLDKTWEIGSAIGLNTDKNRYKSSLFYQWTRPNVQIRGLIDTDCSVGFTYLKYLPPVPGTLTLSLFYCYPTNKFTCGFKFNLDSNIL